VSKAETGKARARYRHRIGAGYRWKVILSLLGPNVIWAACAPAPQSAANPMAISSDVFIVGLSKGISSLFFHELAGANYRATYD